MQGGTRPRKSACAVQLAYRHSAHHHHNPPPPCAHLSHQAPTPTGDAWAALAMSESSCYCQTPLHQGGANVAALACGHVFHEACFHEHQRHSGIRDLGDLRCPECRMDEHACSQREAALMREDTPTEAEPARKRLRTIRWPSSQDRERVHKANPDHVDVPRGLLFISPEAGGYASATRPGAGEYA